ATLEVALAEAQDFDPQAGDRRFRIHLSDIGEARLLPLLMQALRKRAPRLQLETLPMPIHDIADALDRGLLDLAVGFLAGVTRTQQLVLRSDHYQVLLRQGHPLLQTALAPRWGLAQLRELEFVAVRSHSETLRILQVLDLQSRIRLTAAHFMAVPSVVAQTNLAVIMPAEIAASFVSQGGYVAVEADLPDKDFDICLHWSWRFNQEPANQWLRALVQELFEQRRTTADPR
ncbi:MAG: LysR family transcriptional regulator, partial [Comamonas sp.]|nr:LysR family transcriptional regulator [Comamonas sp.]